MEFTKNTSAHRSLPAGQRSNARLTDSGVPNAILYVTEHGRKWRGSPGRFGY